MNAPSRFPSPLMGEGRAGVTRRRLLAVAGLSAPLAACGRKGPLAPAPEEGEEETGS